MEQLPSPLRCLTLQGVLDDLDAMEVLLSEDSDVEKCIPIALRDAFSMPSIPDAITALNYLLYIWRPVVASTHDKYVDLARRGLTYLLPYVEKSPNLYQAADALDAAAEAGHLTTVKYLLRVPLRDNCILQTCPWISAVREAYQAAARSAQKAVMSYLESLPELQLQP